MKKFLLLTFISISINLHPQDLGYSQMYWYYLDDSYFSRNNRDAEKTYLRNCLLETINVTKKWDNLIGKTVIYNNTIPYTQNNAPYPYYGGRVRSGKYESSKATFDSYVNELKSYKNKKFKFVKAIDINYSAYSGKLLLVDEKNDTIAYDYSHEKYSRDYERELIFQDYLDFQNAILSNLRKEMINKEFVYTYHIMKKDLHNVYIYTTNSNESINNYYLPCDSIFVNPYDTSWHNTRLRDYNNPLQGIDTIHYSYWLVKNVEFTQKDDWTNKLNTQISPFRYNIKIELYNKKFGNYYMYLELNESCPFNGILFDFPVAIYRNNNNFEFAQYPKPDAFFLKKNDKDSYIWKPEDGQPALFTINTFNKNLSNFKSWIQAVGEILSGHN